MPGIQGFDGAIRAELVRNLYSYAPTSGLVFLVISWVFSVLLWDTAPHYTLILWMCALYLGIGGRFLLGWAFQRRRPGDDAMAPWAIGAAVSALYHGLVWGVTAILFLDSGEAANLIIVTATLFGLSSAAMVVLSPFLPSFFLFVLPSMGMLIFVLGSRSDPLYGSVLVVALAALGANISHALRVHRFLVESLQLRFENLALRVQQEEKSKLLETTLHNIDQGIGMVDAQGRLRLWNQHFRDLLGLAGDLANTDLTAALKKVDSKLPLCGGARTEYMRPDGRVIDLVQGPMPGGGRVLTLTDITDLKRRESALDAARRTAEQANAAKTRFLSAASHDLRQPIHALGLFLNSLAEQVRCAETQPLIGPMEETLQVIERMLDTLLDISKLDAGVLQPNIGPVEINKLFNQLEAEFRPIARETGNRLRIRPCRLWVRSDPCLLLRMLGNLVANALKFTQGGRVLVAARIRGDRLSCEVYDTGPGIPTDRHEDIFQEFHQLGNLHRDRRQGLGLGLAIVRRLGLLLEHRVEIRSQPGRGSRFAVWVPVARPQPLASASQTRQSPNGDELKGARVLLLDDDIIVQTAMTGLLTGWRCQVLAASSVQQALEHLEGDHTPPDLLIADYRLPGNTTGAEAIELLHFRWGQRVPALIVTGDTFPERLRDAESKGYPLLHKPTPPEKLRSLLRHTLADRNSGTRPC